MVFSQNSSQVIFEKSTAGSFLSGTAFAAWNEQTSMTKPSAVTDFMTFPLEILENFCEVQLLPAGGGGLNLPMPRLFASLFARRTIPGFRRCPTIAS